MTITEKELAEIRVARERILDIQLAQDSYTEPEYKEAIDLVLIRLYKKGKEQKI